MRQRKINQQIFARFLGSLIIFKLSICIKNNAPSTSDIETPLARVESIYHSATIAKKKKKSQKETKHMYREISDS